MSASSQQSIIGYASEAIPSFGAVGSVVNAVALPAVTLVTDVPSTVSNTVNMRQGVYLLTGVVTITGGVGDTVFTIFNTTFYNEVGSINNGGSCLATITLAENAVFTYKTQSFAFPNFNSNNQFYMGVTATYTGGDPTVVGGLSAVKLV